MTSCSPLNRSLGGNGMGGRARCGAVYIGVSLPCDVSGSLATVIAHT
jgi:hypothetical protein